MGRRASARLVTQQMRTIEVIRSWSFKTKNGRWTLRPGEPAFVPAEVAIAGRAQAVLKTSEISPIIPLDNAYYILMVEATKPAVTKPLSEVQPEIVQALVQEEKLKGQERWLKELRAKAYIKIL